MTSDRFSSGAIFAGALDGALRDDCPSEDVILDFAMGRLTASVIEQVEEHLAGCANCRTLVAAAARDPTVRAITSQVTTGRLGKYEIGEPVGSGGMGIVYRARVTGTNVPVALKRVTLPLAPQAVAALRREIEILRRLSHPGIVRILEQGTVEGEPYYVMDFIEGESLERRIRAHSASERPGAPREQPFQRVLPLLGILSTVAKTLAFLHGNGVVHGDLSPRNVLITRDNVPILSDFGLARVRDVQSRESLESHGEKAGTLAYMAPEQLRGELTDARADLYSLGCILYEVLTGSPPPSSERPRHSNELREPTAFIQDLPDALNSLTLQLLAEEPGKRPAYAVDVAAQLGAIADAAPSARFASNPGEYGYIYRPEFVGRAGVFATLMNSLSQCGAGRGSRVGVLGECGIGKTRLLVEAIAGARTRGLRVVTTSFAPPVPSAPQTSPLLRGLLGAVADACRRGGSDVNRRLLGDRGPLLAAFDPAPQRWSGEERQPDLDWPPAGPGRTSVFAAIEQTVRELVAIQPMLVAVDDAQWMDETSLSFLKFLQGNFFHSSASMLLIAWRSGETSRTLHDELCALVDEFHELPRFNPSEVRAMTERMLATSELPAGLEEALVRASHGNPFFVAEYLNEAVRRQHLLRDGAGRWTINQLDWPSIPTTPRE
jgi:hypothetical protein